jgi:hypothetical protein
MWVPASGFLIRGKEIKWGEATVTVGELLEVERQGASQYPNQIRYGEIIYHAPPEMVLNAATLLLRCAREKWDKIRLPSNMQ